MTLPFNFSAFNGMPKEWAKNAGVRALKEGGTALVEDIANEFSVEQLDKLIATLTRVRKAKRNTVDCEVIIK